MFWGLIQKKNPSEEETRELKKNLKVFELPAWVMVMASVNHILGEKLGFIKSAEELKPVLGDGESVPMFSYGLIEYLMNLDMSEMDVLEFGAGNSTMFWAKRVKSVTSLENSEQWYNNLKARALKQTTLHLTPDGEMPKHAKALQQKFDIISVDCGENRYGCAKVAIALLNKGGFIILDNSEWYPNTSNLLRDAGYLQVDFYGFRPCHHYSAVTSAFFDRTFQPKPLGENMPGLPIGGREQNPLGWDKPTS